MFDKTLLLLYKKLLLLFFCIPFISCNNAKDTAAENTWIGGQIINPKIDYVMILKDKLPIDSIKLDKDNHFLVNPSCIKSGLYSFKHNELQLIYLEPGDSLMLRVNTVDFDESLAFTGKGAERNNLLMELFLINERELQIIPSYYNLSPTGFQKKIDSLRSIRKKLYDEFFAKNPSEEEGFKEVALANFTYADYTKKELYTIANNGELEVSKKEDFPKDFYSYRKKLDFGNENLRFYYPYYRFFNSYFDNLAYLKYADQEDYNSRTYLHTINKVKLIDSLITNDTLKNNLLRRNVYYYILDGKDGNKKTEVFDFFQKKNTNPKHIASMKKLYDASLALTPGKKIPNLFLLNTDNTLKDIHSVLKRPSVIYFWSSQSIKHFKNIHIKAAELKSKYPEYDFIGINTDTHFKKWRTIVTKSGYDTSMEFQFDNIDEAEKKLILNAASKTFIVDKDGTIIDRTLSLFSSNMEAQLLGYLNR